MIWITRLWCMAVLLCSHYAEDASSAQRTAIPHCGVACTYAVLRVYGRGVPLEIVEARFRELYPGANLARLSLGQVRSVIVSFGLHARAVRVDLRFPRATRKEAILFLGRGDRGEKKELGHLVLLHATSEQGAQITDFAAGGDTFWVPLDKLRRFCDGNMLLVSDEPISVPIDRWRVVVGLTAAAALLGMVVLLFRRSRGQ